MNRSLTALSIAAVLFASAAHAQAPAAKLVPAQSEIGFVSKQLGVPVEGKFRKFDAQIALDPKKPETGSVAFTIDTASATIGDKDTDAEMGKAPWFGVAKFPTASFKSTAIKALGGGKFEVAGALTIKGSTQNIVVPVTLTQAGANSTAVGGFTMKRIDFKIGEGEWADTSMVANEVQVKFKLALTGLGPL
jgi:polyisoprenoid-binding protein YceI